MGIEYLDRTHARLVVSIGSGKDRIRKVKRITCKSKKDAKEQYEKFRQTVLAENTIDPDMTIDELLTWYIDRFRSNGGKTTTIRAYNTARKPIIAFFGHHKAKDINLYHIDAFIASEAEIRSPKTIKNEISLLNASYKQAIRRGILAKNPCEYVQIPKQVKPEITILTEDDRRRFQKALDTVPIDFKVMCELALYCGLRKSEIFGLYSDEVGETVTISRVRHHIKKQDIIQTPKSATSNRTLAVPSFIREDIRIMQQDQKSRPNKCAYLIRNLWGEPPGAYWCDKYMKKLVTENGLPEITMHGLRHTYASMLIEAGVPVSEVSAQLGHASVDITLRTYTHLYKEASTASKLISDLMENKVKI